MSPLLGMGRYTSRLVHCTNEILKLQQSQEAGSIFINEIKNIIITVFCGNCRDQWTNDTWRNAGCAVYHRTTQLSRRTIHVIYLFTSGCENIS